MLSALLMFHRLVIAMRYSFREEDFGRILAAEKAARKTGEAR